MFDTHCHLNFDVFDAGIDEVIKNANKSGVDRIVVPGVDIESSKRAVELASKYSSLYAACGLHPTESLNEDDLDAQMAAIEKIADNAEVVAIGEIGLDYYKYKSPIGVQKVFFVKQFELAAKLGKSVIIHIRQSSEALVEILTSIWRDGMEGLVVFHCVEPQEILLEFAKKHKVYLGFDGDITYDEDKQKFIKSVPLELLVVETDSPFLIPFPLRKKGVRYNEPKNLQLVIKKIAELTGRSEGEIRQVTTKNALNLFNIK